MAKADRLERLDILRAETEQEYHDALIAALRDTAGGVWGLFDHQQERRVQARIAPVIEALDDIARAIDGMRARLAMEPFALHNEFHAARGPVATHAPGEPKQAQAWLRRLGVSDRA